MVAKDMFIDVLALLGAISIAEGLREIYAPSMLLWIGAICLWTSFRSANKLRVK